MNPLYLTPLLLLLLTQCGGGSGNGIPVTAAAFPPQPALTSAFSISDGFTTSTQSVSTDVNTGDPESPDRPVMPQDGTPVPGPLPAAGALAAFGFSRKLRARLRQR